ncbi:DUF1648 domain-containing protein [Salinicoccus siamensis]|uniref:DUF1648 domain-containing protein n=1 Tax=Salinicoccus siamensis TaxID=381830 RepID=A0ABV5Z574_9STAP
MKERPKIDIPKTLTEKIANIIGYGFFIGSLIYVIITFSSLPAEVPAHFGADGEVDRYGSKYEMIVLIVIPLLLVPGLKALDRFPEMHNYPKRMDASNVREFYLNNRLLLNLTTNGTLIVFAILYIEITNHGLTGSSTFGVLLMPLILLFVLGPIAWKMIERFKIK